MRRALVGLFALAVLAATPLAAFKDDAANPAAPSFRLPDASGVNHQLTDYKGQVLLIDFWASWCIPCKASFPKLDGLHNELRARGFSVLAINLDEERRAVDAFLATRPHVMPVLFDPAGTTAAAFGIRGMPSSVLVDRHGAIRFVHMGYTDKTQSQYRTEINQLLAEPNE